jgi:hypothetical protein
MTLETRAQDRPRMSSPTRDDRVLRSTRITSAVLVPVLVTAAVILYLFPDDTERLFAWPMRPRPTALIMGAGYFTGAYFFARLAFASRWHRAGVPLPGVATFAALLAVLSVLHWDEFNFGHIAFYAWVIVYGLAPFVVVVIWWRNRATDSGRPDAADVLVPRQVRLSLAVLGVMLLGSALIAFIRPDLVTASWPWNLSERGARAMAAWVALPGAAALTLASEIRWSAWRMPMEGTGLWALLIVIALPRAFEAIDPTARLGVVGVVLVWLASVVGLYGAMEWRRLGRGV